VLKNNRTAKAVFTGKEKKMLHFIEKLPALDLFWLMNLKEMGDKSNFNLEIQ